MKIKLTSISLPLVIVLFVICSDQISKLFAVKFFVTVCNFGVAFGLSLGAFSFIFGLLLVFLIAFLLSRLILTVNLKDRSTLNVLGLSLILGGGISNLLDRLIRGCVVDFINLGIWPSFNLADTAITIGACVLIYTTISKVNRRS